MILGSRTRNVKRVLWPPPVVLGSPRSSAPNAVGPRPLGPGADRRKPLGCRYIELVDLAGLIPLDGHRELPVAGQAGGGGDKLANDDILL